MVQGSRGDQPRAAEQRDLRRARRGAADPCHFMVVQCIACTGRTKLQHLVIHDVVGIIVHIVLEVHGALVCILQHRPQVASLHPERPKCSRAARTRDRRTPDGGSGGSPSGGMEAPGGMEAAF